MKTFPLVLCAMLLLGLTTVAVAQNIFGPTMSSSLYRPPPSDEDSTQDPIEEHLMMERSPAAQLARQNSMRHNMLSSWTGDGTGAFAVWGRKGGRKFFRNCKTQIV